MKRQTRILQQGVQILAIHRRPSKPQERIRSEQDESQKRGPDRTLHGKHPRPKTIWQVTAENRC